MRDRKNSNQSGFTLIELMIVIAIIAIIAAIAIPNLLGARKSANESRAIGNLRSIFTAQTQDDIEQVPDLSKTIGPSGSKGPYTSGSYTFVSRPDSATLWVVTAVPAPNAGDRAYYVDTTGVIRVSTAGTPPGASSPPVNQAPPPFPDLTELGSRYGSVYLELCQVFWEQVPEGSEDEVAEYLVHLMDGGFVQSTIEQLDADEDGLVQLHDIESANILQTARSLREGIELPDGPEISDDDEILAGLAEAAKGAMVQIAMEFGDPEQVQGGDVDQVLTTAAVFTHDLGGCKEPPEE